MPRLLPLQSQMLSVEMQNAVEQDVYVQRSKVFLARDSMHSAIHAITRPAVCLSVRHTGRSVKKVEVKIMQFSPYVSPIPLVVSSRNSNGFPERVRQIRKGWVIQAIFYLHASISRKRCEMRPKLLLMTTRKLHMRFRLASRPMTLDDLERW